MPVGYCSHLVAQFVGLSWPVISVADETDGFVRSVTDAAHIPVVPTPDTNSPAFRDVASIPMRI